MKRAATGKVSVASRSGGLVARVLTNQESQEAGAGEMSNLPALGSEVSFRIFSQRGAARRSPFAKFAIAWGPKQRKSSGDEGSGRTAAESAVAKRMAASPRRRS